MKWQPKDVIAILVIIIAGVLLLKGIDTIVGWSLLAVVCAYYGIDFTPFIKLGRNQKEKEIPGSPADATRANRARRNNEEI